jgi:N6-L-threonylcarbamoyladenine synthase
MSTILGIESTCDETAAAVVVDSTRVLSSVVASQVELHAKYRGVVPEIASRAHIENILPVIREAIEVAGVSLDQLDAIAVACRPGLIGSLLIGVTAAKTLAWALGKPLIAVDHVQAHLYSVMLDEATRTSEAPDVHPGLPPRSRATGMVADKEDVPLLSEPGKRATSPLVALINPGEATATGEAPDVHPGLRLDFPAIGMVCSGGHTALYHVRSWSDITMIGSTIDDAVGEAYDKVAAILGLGYPGGPIIDRLARDGNPQAIRFPRTLLDHDSLDFSFSGLKTSVLYHVRGVPTRRDPQPARPAPTEAEIRDIAASFQAACIDTITKKLTRAIDQFGANSVIIGGGVSANRGLRAVLARFRLPVHFPLMNYCTDNAAMIGGLGQVLFNAGVFSELGLDAITYSQFRR